MTPVIFNMVLSIILMAFQPSNSGLIFSHASHYGDRDIECATCHNVTESVSATDKNIPGHDECSSCHSVSNSPDDCKLCHSNAENPEGISIADREVIFSHKRHLDADPTSQECLVCHTGVDLLQGRAITDGYPSMEQCFECHDGISAAADCEDCHSQPAMMTELVHPPDWDHAHKFAAANQKSETCMPCHHTETFCSDCHAGDNLVESVHDLNFRFNHGLEVKGKEFECQACHDFETFCVQCHGQNDAIPYNHFYSQWSPRINPQTHADAARQDIESCASCHAEERSTCSQPGCHSDNDGIRGTDANIHASNIDDLGKGPWHDDPSFECFQCHSNTERAGIGFCGYCHGEEGD